MILCVHNFGDAKVPGPLWFHNNLVLNPGRGILWTKGTHDKISIYNNHIKANTMTRKDGLFGINPKSNFKNIEIRDNIIECNEANPRSLMRNEQSYGAKIENNQLTNVTDSKHNSSSDSGKKAGLVEPLNFKCGVKGEYTVDQWKVKPTK